MSKPTCNWILSGVREFPVRRCGAPVKYHIMKDDDGEPRREYDNLCGEHQKAAELQGNTDDQ